jgi:hypothetical protein
MNHDEAIRINGTEQYLLNELSPELREQFEEHFFECAECANDLRAGALFIEQSKAIFAAEAVAPPREVPTQVVEKPSWWAWLRPAVSVPVMALLLAVIAYQNWPSHGNPQVLQAAYLNIGSRGAVPSISTGKGQGFLLRVMVPPDQTYSSYSADIYAPDGKLSWSLNLPLSAGQDSYFIQVPAGSYNDGVYSVAIRGTAAGGNTTELGRGNFELHISK